MSEGQRRLEVLLVEDNKGDAFLISELLRDTGLEVNITVAENGQRALAMLKRAGEVGAHVPDFVILDLNLPKVHGFEVLTYIRYNPSLKSVPVVVMTGSLNKEDEARAREIGVTDYRIKPSSQEDFNVVCKWLKTNLEPLTGRRQNGNHECAPNAVTMGHMTGRRMPSRPAFNGGMPLERVCPSLKDWSFKPIG